MLYTRNRKTYYYLGFFLFLVISFHYLGILRPLEYAGRSFIVPIISNLYDFKVNLNNSNFSNSEAASTTAWCENNQQQIVLLSAQVKNLENENKQLKEQVDFKAGNPQRWITTAVLGRSLDGVEKTIIIRGGTNDGIKVNQPVIAGKGILVGKIIKTENDIAVVRLISDGQFNISGMIINKSNSLGIVEGGYGLSLRLKFIPRNEVVVVGDTVVTGGLETECPLGLLVGSVAVVENEAYKPFQQAVLTPALDLARLNVVSVLAK
ncbi:MAG: rod shape-determining protein MreC [Candidatus Magasanikbacteria bacterium]